jgi:ABC-type branched-subunit amino acid transport system substrate-binding protein
VGSTDVSSIVSNIESEDPDILFMTLVAGSIPAIQNEMHNRGLRDQWTEVGLAHGQIELAGIAPEKTEGVLNAQPYFPNLGNEQNQAFVDQFNSEYGEDSLLHFLTGPAYTAMNLLEEAVNQAGGSSSQEVLDGFSAVSTESIMGEVSFPHDNQIRSQAKIAEVTDGEYEIIEDLDGVMPDEACDDI